MSGETKAIMKNTPQDDSNHLNELLGLPPTQSYFLKKFLGLAREIARGYMNCICSSADQMNADLCEARTVGKWVCIIDNEKQISGQMSKFSFGAKRTQ